MPAQQGIPQSVAHREKDILWDWLPGTLPAAPLHSLADAIKFDTGQMRQVKVDTEARTVTLGAGCLRAVKHGCPRRCRLARRGRPA